MSQAALIDLKTVSDGRNLTFVACDVYTNKQIFFVMGEKASYLFRYRIIDTTGYQVIIVAGYLATSV